MTFNMKRVGIQFFVFPMCLFIATAGGLAQNTHKNNDRITGKELTSMGLLQNSPVEEVRTFSFLFEETPLKDALQQVSDKGRFKLLVNHNLLPVNHNQTVSMKLEDVNLREAFDLLLAETSLDIMLAGNGYIIIVPKLEIQKIDSEQETIAGTVTDAATGEALPGVNIVVKGTERGTNTDSGGQFNLTVDSLTEVLIFSYIGYISREVPLDGRTEIHVSLNQTAIIGEEMVVIGYGQVQRRDLTGSVNSVRAERMNTGVQSNVDQMIQGRIPGVNVTRISARPGGAASIRIRGATSITAGNEPLYVIDGLPGAPLNALNPGDIESIEVLKDASAAAIYGSRGANGVILITTRQGQREGVRIDYGGYWGVQEVAKKLDMLNGSEYMTFINDVRSDNGLEPMFTEEEINAIGSGTDWQDEVLRAAPVHNHQFSISGGVGDTRYYLSLSHLNQQGIVISTDMKRYTARLNVNHSMDRFNFGLNLNTSLVQDAHVPAGVGINEGAGVIATAVQMDPVMPARNEDGTYMESIVHDLDNPVAQANTIFNDVETNRTFGNVFAEYMIRDNVSARINFGSNRHIQRADNYITNVTKRGQRTNSRAVVSNNESSSYLAELTLNYEQTLGVNHRIDAVAGYTFQEFNNRGFSASANNFITDAFRTNNLGAGDREDYDIGSFRNKNQLLSWLGRVNYSFRDTYLATVSFRADGSSRFGEGNRFAYFPSLALAWRLSNETFVHNLNIFSDLKLRASYGITGNQEIGNYNSLVLLGTVGDAVFDGSRFVSIAPIQLSNPDLKWETTEQYNIGLDFSFLEDRITGSLDYFVKETSDLLLNLPIPSTSGFTTSLQNVGDTRNNGFEFMIDSRNLVGSFGWSTLFSFATLKNEVTNLGDLPFILQGGIRFIDDFTILRVGDPINSYYGYEVEGIFQDQPEIDASAQPNARPGDLKFSDVNGDGQITAEDRTILGDPFPDFTIGLSNTFSYRGIELDLFLEGSYGHQMLNFTKIDSEHPIEFLRNRQRYVLDRWTAENPTNNNPSFANMDVSRALNSRVVEDASYLRLRNVRLSYTFPTRFHAGGVSAKSVYASAQNLFTITNYTGYDPDVSVLGTSNLRVDYNAYPYSRIYTIGINIGF